MTLTIHVRDNQNSQDAAITARAYAILRLRGLTVQELSYRLHSSPSMIGRVLRCQYDHAGELRDRVAREMGCESWQELCAPDVEVQI